ncbi:MAG: zinc ribbon domain-containing protein, partial [Streptosporangiaceae bacterium]
MKASPEAQQRLLELADFDAELNRLDHRRRTLPEIEEADRIGGRDRELHDEIVALEAEEKDLSREQGKAEADVEQVRARVDRDRKRLDGGQVSSARELENLQSEIASLVRRQSDLEEIVLDVMERREGAQSRRDARAAERSGLAEQLGDVVARRDAALAEIAEEAGKARGERAEVAAGEPADLMALYEKLRE